MSYEFVQLAEEEWAALPSDRIAHVLLINEIEKIMVPVHLGYADKVVRAIMPNFPNRRLHEVEVHWETSPDDPDLAWKLLDAKGVTDRRQYQIAQMLFDAGYGATCICAAIKRR